MSQTLTRWWLDTDLQAATVWGCGLSWSESLGWDLIFVRTTNFFPCSITFSVFSTATSLGLSCNLWSSSSMWLVWLPVFLYESVFCTFLQVQWKASQSNKKIPCRHSYTCLNGDTRRIRCLTSAVMYLQPLGFTGLHQQSRDPIVKREGKTQRTPVVNGEQLTEWESNHSTGHRNSQLPLNESLLLD